MHLVFVSSLLPVENPTSGFDIANSVVLDVLRAQDGVRVSAIGYKSPETMLSHQQDTTVLGEMEVTTHRVSRFQQLKWLATAMLNRTSFSSAKMLACGHRKIAASLATMAPVDGLILNSVQLPGAFMELFAQYPSIFIAHNVEAGSAVENSRHANGAFEKWLYNREAKYLSGLEQRLCTQAKFVWTLSDEDRNTLGVASDNKSAVLPLVTHMAPPAMAKKTIVPTYDIGLIGTWSWRPNRIGLDWFLNAVTPHLPSGIKIAIAGNLPEQNLHRRYPGIEFLGRVDDAREFVRACRVIPLPSIAGTGVQLKTIEIFELGMPSVATSVALRGIGCVPPNCIVVDEPVEFASALVRTLAQYADLPSDTGAGRRFHSAQISGLTAAIQRGLIALQDAR